MYEHKTHPPLPQHRFIRRILLHLTAAIVLLITSLTIGMTGYIHFEHFSLHDAFLNSAMLMGGMGQIDPPKTDHGKIFAGIFALYAGIIFMITAGLIFTPIAHRLLHLFHWERNH